MFSQVFVGFLRASGSSFYVVFMQSTGVKLVLWGLLLLLAIGAAPSDASCGERRVLNSGWRFVAGDDPGFALADFNDSGWDLLADRAGQGGLSPGLDWLRLHFTLPQSFAADPALLLPPCGDSVEVYLNGVRIGGAGVIGGGFVAAARVPRLYRIPPKLLEPGNNLLALRVANLYPRPLALRDAAVLGDFRDLRLEHYGKIEATKAIEIVLFTFLFIWMESCLFLYVNGICSREYLGFGLFMLIYIAVFFLNSLSFELIWSKSHVVQQVGLACTFVLPAAILFFLTTVHDRPNRPQCLLMLAFLLLASAVPVLSGFSALRVLVYIWLLLCVAGAAMALALACRIYRKRLAEAGPLLAGVCWLCLAGGFVLIQRLGVLPELPGEHVYPSFYFILLVWIIIIKFGLIVRYARIKAAAELLSGRLISAQEEERKRLARELHDGMGQTLLAIKLKLQDRHRELHDPQIGEATQEVSACINDLRAILAGLMPVALQSMGLAESLVSYAGQFGAKTGIRVSVNAEDSTRWTPEIELNLFRIFQEALNNVAKHSHAGSVEVYLLGGRRSLVLLIRDDGRGFDTAPSSTAGAGMGLSIMTERARLLNGRLHVQSAAGAGTTIKVEVPLS